MTSRQGSWLDRLDRKYGHLGIPNVTLYLVAGQAIFFILGRTNPRILEQLVLIPERVLQGEIWRLFLFIFMPPGDFLLFVLIALYIFYLFGSALESQWGAFRYNVYLLIGYLATVGSAFIVPGAMATNIYISTSVFLAFAFLYPDFEILLFFILPVKVKWLAAITWALLIFQFLATGWSERFLIQASVLNFFVFFGKEITQRVKAGFRRTRARQQAIAEQAKPFHVCTACGLTDKDDPNMDFRYCSSCSGSKCYCSNHIYTHEHV